MPGMGGPLRSLQFVGVWLQARFTICNGMQRIRATSRMRIFLCPGFIRFAIPGATLMPPRGGTSLQTRNKK